MRVSFLSQQLPPAVCGVADHTWLLARTMAGQDAEVGFIHRVPVVNGGEPLPGPRNLWEGGAAALARCVARQAPDWLWVQFSNYGFSRWGAPYRLGRDLKCFRQRMPHVRVAVCLHETHCLPHQLGRKGRLLSPWQRYTVGAIARLGDVVFTAVPLYRKRAVEDYRVPPDKIFSLPIGSNIPPAAPTPGERARLRESLGWGAAETVAVVFGTYPSQLRALQLFGSLLRKGMEQGRLQRVVCLGGDRPDAPAELAAWQTRFPRPALFQLLGPRPACEVGRLLAGCDFALSPTQRPLLEKSGAFMAYAFAGLAVLVASPPGYGDFEADGLPVLASETWDWGHADSPSVAALRSALQKHAHTHYTWESIARRALARMALVMTNDQGRMTKE
jgi:hypothetical protein